MTDAEFIAAFEAGTLPRDQWTHAAHLHMAFLYLRDSGGDAASTAAALDRVRNGIKAYNAAQNNLTGYHETMTVAFVRLVADRLRRRTDTLGVTFDAFQTAHPDLFDRRILLRHYSKPRLLGDCARASFVEPDGLPLPDFEGTANETTPP